MRRAAVPGCSRDRMVDVLEEAANLQLRQSRLIVRLHHLPYGDSGTPEAIDDLVSRAGKPKKQPAAAEIDEAYITQLRNKIGKQLEDALDTKKRPKAESYALVKQIKDELKKELQAHVVKEIGALARPDEIRFTESLPKTRSGKIMRRLLRDIAEGRELGDVTTLRDPKVTEMIQERMSSGGDGDE